MLPSIFDCLYIPHIASLLSVKKLGFLLGFVVVALVCVFFFFKRTGYEITIPQEKIDETLSEKFPISKNYLVVFSITYSNPEVTLLSKEDRVQVGLDATLNIALSGEKSDLKGGATLTGGIRYDNEAQEFFLNEVKFERFEIQGVPEKWLDKVTEIGEILARELVEKQPVYRLENLEIKDGKTAVAKLLLKDFEVREQEILVTLGL